MALLNGPGEVVLRWSSSSSGVKRGLRILLKRFSSGLRMLEFLQMGDSVIDPKIP